MNIQKTCILATTAFSFLAFTACNDNNTNESVDSNVEVPTAPEVLISPVGSSPQFENAVLTVKNIKSELQGDSVKLTFNYGVENYELKNQTEDASGKGCANSKDGQHIHFILDNGPYAALYEPTHSFTVAKNSDHYVMSFLSRSYHESVKAPKAAVVKHFSVDGNGQVTEKEIPNTPMVFYSRPKGDYLGKDTEKILFDFYVYNATLGHDAMVKATINNKDFEIKDWQSYFIENAPMGDLNIKLQLYDNAGNELSGDNTSVSRTSKLAKEEPMN